jgi:hypothetical protein
MKDIKFLTIHQTVKRLPKKIDDRHLKFTPGCGGQSFNASYEGKSGFGPTAWEYTLGKAARALLRLIKCAQCGMVETEDNECGRSSHWHVVGERENTLVFCSLKCEHTYHKKFL